MWMGAPKFVRLKLLINLYITEFQTPQQFEVFVFSPVWVIDVIYFLQSKKNWTIVLQVLIP